MKAWIATIDTFDAVVFAPTRGKASWLAVRSYREAGYGNRYEWPNVRTVRAKHYDASPCRLLPRQQCWAEEYVNATMNCVL